MSITPKAPVARCIVKSIELDGKPYAFWASGQDNAKRPTVRVRRRAVWHVIWDGKSRRIVTTLERGLQERGML